jgi:hypothetical protein
VPDPPPKGPGPPPNSPGPPPLRPFGLVLHHDGSWTHEGQPIRHRRMREHFDRHVRFLPDEGKYVVFLRHFRGEIEVEEAAFFVRHVDPATGEITLSDGTRERLDAATLRRSPRDGAWLCSVKTDLAPGGLPARFERAAQAELMAAAEERDGRVVVRLGERLATLPDGLD